MIADDVLSSSGNHPERVRLADALVISNAKETARRVSMLLTSFSSSSKEHYERRVRSGFRDVESNRIAGGAKNSAHLWGMAVDLEDVDRKLSQWCLQNIDLLKHFQLWIENPSKTPTWLHVQTRFVSSRSQVFEP